MLSDMQISVMGTLFFQPGYILKENPSATSKLECVADKEENNSIWCKCDIILAERRNMSSKMRHFSLIDPLQEYNKNSPLSVNKPATASLIQKAI